MSVARGRGFSLPGANGRDGPQTELRRPGQTGLQQRLGNGTLPQSRTQNAPEEIGVKFSTLCDELGKMNLSSSKELSDSCAKKIVSLCDTPQNLEKFANNLLAFALKSKWNSHVAAMFCDSHGDINAGDEKLRTLMLRKLQKMYYERNKAYLNKDAFVLDATFVCEIFHHVRIDGECIKILSNPILEYLGMLVDGASQKEVEAFTEQFPKCSAILKENDPSGFDLLVGKIRKQIISESTTVVARAMLLQMFELVISGWKPLDQNSKFLYESLSKPIIRICD